MWRLNRKHQANCQRPTIVTRPIYLLCCSPNVVPLLPEFPSCVFPYQFLMFLLPGSFSFGFSGCSSVFVLQTLVMFYCVAGCSAFVFPTSTQLATAIRFRLDVMRVKQKVDTVTAIIGDIRGVPIQVSTRFNHII